MARRYTVLRRNSIESIFEQIERALDAVQDRTGLLFGFSHTDEQDGVEVQTWRELRHGAALIRLVDDPVIDTRYLLIEAPSDNEVCAIAQTLGEVLPLETIDRLEQQARAAMDRQPAALVRLALATAQGGDPVTLKLILRGLRSDRVQTREAAITAAALTCSPSLVPELKRLETVEDDEGLRRMIAQAIRDCEGTFA
jgi:hypothetical protein